MKRARKDMKDAVEALINKRIARAYAQISGLVGAAGGSYVVNKTTAVAQVQSAANEVCIAAVALPMRSSGLVDVECNVGYASGTTAKTVEHKLVLIPFAAPAAQTFSAGAATGTAAGVAFGKTIGPDASAANRAVWGETIAGDAAGVSAAGVLYNGVALTSASAGAVLVQDSGAVPTLAGLLTAGVQVFDFAGTCPAGFAPRTFFPTGAGQFLVAALILLSTAGGDTVTYQYTRLSMQERLSQ